MVSDGSIEFPGDRLPANYQDQHSRRLIPQNEIDRRSRYMDSLHTMLGRSHGLITQCLDYTPSARPTASQAMDRLQHISSHIQDDYHSMIHLELEKATKAKDDTILQSNAETKSMQV